MTSPARTAPPPLLHPFNIAPSYHTSTVGGPLTRLTRPSAARILGGRPTTTVGRGGPVPRVTDPEYAARLTTNVSVKDRLRLVRIAHEERTTVAHVVRRLVRDFLASRTERTPLRGRARAIS